MKTIALYSIKGGVGKTSACVNLAHLAAESGLRTLIIDLDPQASASFYLRIRPKKKFDSQKFLNGKTRKFIRGTDFENLDLVPSDFTFRYFDIQLNEFKKSSIRLKKIISGLQNEYDVIFFDCPPNITLLSENIFNASDLILLPLIPTPLSVQAMEKLFDFFETNKIKHKKLKVFFSMAEKKKKLHKDIIEKLSENKFMLNNIIPFISDIEQMGVTRVPVTAENKSSKGSKAFIQLWQEIKNLLQ